MEGIEVESDIFFFKQKTAYEMCGRDWSSDVCSSDLDFVTDLIKKYSARTIFEYFIRKTRHVARSRTRL